MKEFINNLKKKAREDFDKKFVCNYGSEEKEESVECFDKESVDEIRKHQDQLIADIVKATLEEVGKNYNELLLAVENKYKGKTRHETALMLIKNAQSSSMGSAENNKLNSLN